MLFGAGAPGGLEDAQGPLVCPRTSSLSPGRPGCPVLPGLGSSPPSLAALSCPGEIRLQPVSPLSQLARLSGC